MLGKLGIVDHLRNLGTLLLLKYNFIIITLNTDKYATPVFNISQKGNKDV